MNDQADSYYTLDTSLFDGRFTYFSRDLEPVLVRGKIHTEQEQYSLRPEERDIEPVPTLRGTRTYFHMKPFVLIPRIIVSVGLYSQPTQEGTIGEVISSSEEPHQREIEIGQAQAWFYPTDKTIVLWECFLERFVRDKPLLEDPNMRDLWYGFERFLRKQCVGAERITTPFHDPEFDKDEYQQFLTSLGYQPLP